MRMRDIPHLFSIFYYFIMHTDEFFIISVVLLSNYSNDL